MNLEAPNARHHRYQQRNINAQGCRVAQGDDLRERYAAHDQVAFSFSRVYRLASTNPRYGDLGQAIRNTNRTLANLRSAHACLMRGQDAIDLVSELRKYYPAPAPSACVGYVAKVLIVRGRGMLDSDAFMYLSQLAHNHWPELESRI